MNNHFEIENYSQPLTLVIVSSKSLIPAAEAISNALQGTVEATVMLHSNYENAKGNLTNDVPTLFLGNDLSDYYMFDEFSSNKYEGPDHVNLLVHGHKMCLMVDPDYFSIWNQIKRNKGKIFTGAVVTGLGALGGFLLKKPMKISSIIVSAAGLSGLVLAGSKESYRLQNRLLSKASKALINCKAFNFVINSSAGNEIKATA